MSLVMRASSSMALILAVLAVDAGAQSTAIADRGRPALSRFDDRDGLPQNTIQALTFDGRGLLWIGTQDGAAVYDGRRWTTVDMPERSKTNWVQSICATRDGSIWFGTRLGLHRLRDEVWSTYHLTAIMGSDDVMTLAETSVGGVTTLWVGTSNGLARLREGAWQRVALPLVPGSTSVQLLQPSRDSLWIGTSRSLARWRQEQHERVELEPGFPGTDVRGIVEVTAPDGARTVWATSSAGVVKRERGVWSVNLLSSGHQFRSIIETRSPSGNFLWVTTDGGGLLQWNGRRWRSFEEADGLPNRRTSELLVTPPVLGPPMLWIGTLGGGGLLRMPLNGWRTYDRRNVLPDNGVRGFAESLEGDGDNVIWIATDHGMARVGIDGMRRFDAASGMPNDRLSSVATLKDTSGETVVFAGTGQGVISLEGGRWSFVGGSSIKGVRTIVRGSGPRTLLVGHAGGLSRREGDGSWTHYASRGALAGATVQAIVEGVDRYGAGFILAGTDRGLGEVRGDAVQPVSRFGLAASNIYALHLNRREGRRDLWIGTLGGGVVRIDLDAPASALVLTTATTPALPNDVVYQIREDGRGRIYLATNKGVARLTPSAQGYEVYTFLAADGLPSIECNDGASMIDSEGRLWIGTVSGAAMLDIASEVPDTTPKPLLGERTSIDGRRVAGSRISDISHDATIAFEPLLLSYFRESDTRYRTELAGLDARKGEWTMPSRREFQRLPRGRYTFRVWGRDYAGNISGPLEIPFRVLPAPWLTGWAFALYTLAALAFIAIVARLRTRALEASNLELEEAVSRKTGELTEANARLEQAQGRIESLMASSSRALQDIGAWSRTMAAEVARSVGADAINVWTIDGASVEPLTPTDTAAPAIDEIERLARTRETWEVPGRRVVPVTGLTGQLCGVLTILGSHISPTDSARRVIESFAHQLGGALELQRLRRDLAESEARRSSTRLELIGRGIALLQICPSCKRCYDHNPSSCEVDGTLLESPRIFPYCIANRYRLTRIIGEGGMGVVFEADDLRLERRVAVKVIRSEHFKDTDVRLRFEQEARVLASIDHPNVITIYDSGELDDGSAYLVTELLQGFGLGELIESFGAGTPAQVASLLRQGAAALSAAHRAGIVHRDIKPQNLVLLPQQGGFVVKLLDFGLAKPMNLSSELTRTGTIVGTPSYMSPEQILGGELDARSDLFSFATIGWEALTGRRLVRSLETANVFQEVLHQPAPSLSSILPAMPRAVDLAFEEALTKNHHHRPVTVLGWVESFAEVLALVESNGQGWPSGLQVLRDSRKPVSGSLATDPTIAHESLNTANSGTPAGVRRPG